MATREPRYATEDGQGAQTCDARYRLSVSLRVGLTSRHADIGKKYALVYRRWTHLWLALLVLCMGASCGFGADDAGSFSVHFNWVDPPPETDAWVYGRVERQLGGSWFQVAQAPVEALVPDATLTFPSVEHGEDYRVVIEIRDAPTLPARTTHFGESILFDLRRNRRVDVAVSVGLTEVPGRGDPERQERAVVVMEANSAGYVTEQDVTLSLSSRGATRVVVASDPSLTVARREVALSELRHVYDRHLLDWDLDRERCATSPCPDATVAVYVQFLNDRGYTSEVFDTRVTLDRRGPELDDAVRVSPPVVRDGETFTLAFRLNDWLEDVPQDAENSPPDVTVGGHAIGCFWSDFIQRKVICFHEASFTEGTGARSIEIEAWDWLGNASSLRPIEIEATDADGRTQTLVRDYVLYDDRGMRCGDDICWFADESCESCSADCPCPASE